MKEFLEIYTENQKNIETFLINTLKSHGSIQQNKDEQYKDKFKKLPSMEILYITDKVYKQITPNIYRNKLEYEAKGKDRNYLSNKMIKKDKDFSISEPYISAATGNICITVMKKEVNHFIFIDFTLSELLGRLGLIELSSTFDAFIKNFYRLIGFSLMFFSFITIGYAHFSFFNHLLYSQLSLDIIFNPIISITLSLATFDVAKNILEREVYFKSYGKSSEDSMVLTKFSTAIIIALSIEALMVVFKIALRDYTQMIYALYLIIGVGIAITSLGVYSFLSGKSNS